MTIRERFEAWVRHAYDSPSQYFKRVPGKHGEEYMVWKMNDRWEAWQSGRADGEREAVRACAKLTYGFESNKIRAAYPQHFKE